MHWSGVGAATAKDRDILSWAGSRGYPLVTPDLDFSAILATTGRAGPSVIQIRSESLAPAGHTPAIIQSIERFSKLLEQGAILTLEPGRARVRLLPLKPDPE